MPLPAVEPLLWNDAFQFLYLHLLLPYALYPLALQLTSLLLVPFTMADVYNSQLVQYIALHMRCLRLPFQDLASD